MPEIASQALELGHDGKSLRYLAGLTGPTRREVAGVVDGALQELGIQTPITKRDAALWMARRVASEIIEGRIEPYHGACRIGLSYSPEASELEHWPKLMIEYEVTGEIEKAKQQILQAARNLRDDSSFGATVARFQQFLRKNNYPENMVWLMPEDILLSGKQSFYVRVPIPDTNETNARNIYDQGMAHGRGLLVSTICEMGASTCCYVWFPKRPEEEPQGIWPRDGSVKFSVKMEVSRVRGKPIKSRLLWAFLKSRHRNKQNLKDFLFS
ncbi:MAG TPA: hypothetical protein VGF61_19265 [Candidatus Acidoferrum sp.]|jgi:hypothetical protein